VPAKPHILILMTDQQRADCLSGAGHPVLRTPNLDRIAAEGVRFANAVTTCPLCMPARASFVSGLYCHNHGMWANSGRLPADDETFFHRLRSADYYTGYIGKSHFYEHRPGDHLRNHEDYMHARGIDFVHETTGPWATAKTASYLSDYWGLERWQAYQADYQRRRGNPWATWPSPLSVEDFPDSYVGRRAVEFLSSYDGGQPICLFVSFGGPHEPFDAPGEYASMYNPKRCPPAIPPEPTDGLPAAAEAYVASRWHFLRDRQAVPPEAIAAVRANYYGKISLIDGWVGRILDALTARGWLDDTLVVFWSDHGEMAGDHGRLFKSVFYESALRVPLLLRWPGQIPPGQVRPHLAQTIDVFDTLLEAAGCQPSARSFGKSLLPAARDASAPLRQAAFSEVAWSDGSAGRQESALTTMVCTGRYKYAVNHAGEPLLLFDLREDPHEQNNLLAGGDCTELREQLDRSIYEWLLQTQVCL